MLGGLKSTALLCHKESKHGSKESIVLFCDALGSMETSHHALSTHLKEENPNTQKDGTN